MKLLTDGPNEEKPFMPIKEGIYNSKTTFSKEDIDMIESFGKYTLEAIIVYVLSIVFSSQESSSRVRAATLIDQLNQCVKQHAKHANKNTLSNDDEHNQNDDDSAERFLFGQYLYNVMLEREIINEDCDTSIEEQTSKKKGKYYKVKHTYVCCNFDISLLPLKRNLPMVYPPLEWDCRPDTSFVNYPPRSIFDLCGGYLCDFSGSMYYRYRLLSSKDFDHFHIDISGHDHKKLCNVMNKLQSQPFEINSDWLKYILNNEQLFVQKGLLSPGFYAKLNPAEARILLRDVYLKHEAELKQFTNFANLYESLCKDIQLARYEQFILKLATAYDGYTFYLPAFLDFRGRIYRTGILNLHERDIVRSLIVFGGREFIFPPNKYLNIPPKKYIKEYEKYMQYLQYLPKSREKTFERSTPFYKKSFDYLSVSAKYFLEEVVNKFEAGSSFEEVGFPLAQDAKHPFQLLSRIKLSCDYIINKSGERIMDSIPITQDASASAYQIMSFFLLDKKMAMSTNLILPSLGDKGKIYDIYSSMLNDLKPYLLTKVKKNEGLHKVVEESLNRKIVKMIFMPLIYGKTVMSTAKDLKDSFCERGLLSSKEYTLVANLCFQFWKEEYSGMDCFISLIKNAGWLASSMNQSVTYCTSYFETKQEYFKNEPVSIWIYDKDKSKKRKVTLRIPSDKNDTRKTEIATFVNFIHQKDADIAMRLVEKMTSKVPIYTVHDNFITTHDYTHEIRKSYANVWLELLDPLTSIHKFLFSNVILPICEQLLKKENEGYEKGYEEYLRGDHIKILSFNKNNINIKTEFFLFLSDLKNLKKFLELSIPVLIRKNKSKRSVWQKRIDGLVSSYEQYVYCLTNMRIGDDGCKPLEVLEKYNDNYKSFKENIEKYEQYDYRNYYGVHY
jgi:DNA-directed RNA polymerase